MKKRHYSIEFKLRIKIYKYKTILNLGLSGNDEGKTAISDCI